MARINRSELTKLEIIQAAAHHFLLNGYTNTSVKAICNDLNMSTGNLTFHFPTKEHLLAELTKKLCNFQQDLTDAEQSTTREAILSICLELAVMAVMCEEDEVAKDFYLSAYSSPLALETIRKSDIERAKIVFKDYCKDWSDDQFVEAETLVSGIEYATIMTTGESANIEKRIAGAINSILGIYNVPEDLRKQKIQKVFELDYKKVGKQVFKKFIKFVEQENEQALIDLLKG